MRVQGCIWQIFLVVFVAVGRNGRSLGTVYNVPEINCREMNRRLGAIERKMDILLEKNCYGDDRDCADLYKCGKRRNGVYSIRPDDKGSFYVYCDMTTAGGGWTVFQKRLDGSVDFYKGWTGYKNGFGLLSDEFWLGLDKINRLTNARRYRLHVDLQDINGNKAFAEYDHFAVSSERTNYRLSLGTYSGDAGDSLSYHRGSPFSTRDRDNDNWTKHCAQTHQGAWWHKSCYKSNLNGKYLHGQHSSTNGIAWETWKGYHYSAARAEMKIRPVDF